MRIFHLVSYSLYSGPLPSTLRLACAQRELGHDVWLAHDTKRGSFNSFEESGDPQVAAAAIAPPGKLTLSTKSSPIEVLRDVRTLKKLLKQEVDVLHVHMSHDHTLASFASGAGFPGVRIRTIHAQRSLKNRLGQKNLNRRADGWIVRSEAHRQGLENQLGDLGERVAMIPGPIDTGYFVPANLAKRKEARKAFAIPGNAQVVGHTALMMHRGQEELIDAAQSLNNPTLHLLFVGSGQEHENVKAKAAASSMAERIHFSGYLEGDDLLNGYAAMDAAFSAQAGNDASVRAVLEAMSCGLPVVGVQDGAIADVVDAAVGFPVASRLPQDIATGLEAFLGRQEGTGARARQKMLEERTMEMEAEKTISHYETCARLKG
ncbi:MAG: glycosyltransferase family 4 protein [Deltaproteobacteria bacterium]|jgi:glycosyltransferase involved in cell wall biosynthesis|nr:glycosyltransferase family 4 protein [Deltaproteobacteria bacterium]MBT6490564.1 glycosyltransferase family 4 protein [Deltaproteobacteria bacterium]